MTSPHANPAANGIRFGEVVVTVDLDLGDAVVRAPKPGTWGQGIRETRFNSLDEITGAYANLIGRTVLDPVASDMARALRFAAQQINAAQEGKRHGR